MVKVMGLRMEVGHVATDKKSPRSAGAGNRLV